jgi:4-amino-4-deoxy-L-arabinose transferase-like glycosyltransferase
LLISANFILLGINGINDASIPEAYDTTAYLGEANFIKNNGGLINFLNLCLSGDYKQANQHPLYILLLVPFASTDTSFFIFAKLVNFLIGFIFLLIVYFSVKKMAGNVTASIVVVALLFNVIFIEWNTLVACEALLMLFSFLTIYYIHLGFEKNKYWMHSGIFAGLAYLTKGTSLILLPGFVVSALIIYKSNLFKNKYFWSFFLLFCVTTSPLLIRNVIVYNNPFFNVNNYIITLGVDYLNENRYVTYNPNEGATLWKFDTVMKRASDKKTDDGLSSKLLNLTSKMYHGLKSEAIIFLTSFNVFQNKLSKSVLCVSGIALSLFFIIGIWLEKNKGGRVYLISTIISFLLFLSFNPIDRYFLPLSASLWIYIGIGILSTAEFLNKKILSQKPHIDYKIFAQIILALILISNFVYTHHKKPLKNPLNSVYLSQARIDVLQWLRNNLKDNEKYSLGPNLNWQLSTGIWILPPYNAKTKDFVKFNKFMERHNVSYVIIDTESLSDKKELIKNHFEIDPAEGLIQKKYEPGWELIYKDQSKPIDYLIFRMKNKVDSLNHYLDTEKNII